jgi:predicted dehydrogenase
MIRVGLIGYGYWGPNLARNLVSSRRFELVAIADTRPNSLTDANLRFPGGRVVGGADEILTGEGIDAVVIATPVATHFDFARTALIHGKHVLVEKPMCASVSEAEELAAIAQRCNRTLMVDHTFLFTGAVQMIRKVVESGQLGKICYFDSVRVNLGLFQEDVNCLWDLAPHDLSIINHLLDDKIVSIDIAGYCHVNPTLPDIVYMTLHYAHDTVAHFNLSWMSPVKIRRFIIGGTQRMLVWDDLEQDQKIRIYDSGIELHPQVERNMIIPDYRLGDIYSPRVSRQEALTGVVNHFADVISGVRASIMDAQSGLKVVRILEEAQAALERNLGHVAQRRKIALSGLDRAVNPPSQKAVL